MAKLAGSPPPPVVLKLKVPSPPLVCLCTVRLATAWLVKLQLPAAPGVVSVMLPLLLQPLERKLDAAESLSSPPPGAFKAPAVLASPVVLLPVVRGVGRVA